MVNQDSTEVSGGQVPPPLRLSWVALIVIVLGIWVLFFDGLKAFTFPTSPSTTIFMTATAGPRGETFPTAIVAPRGVGNVLVPTSIPPVRPTAGISGVAVVTSSTPTVVSNTVVPATATPQPCVLTTWADGSQSCSDGRHISEAQSVAGYCKPVVWADGSVSCNNGKPAGNVIWPDPEVSTDPTNTPWPSTPTSDIVWNMSDGPHNNSCITVTFTDGHTQTACSAQDVKYNAVTGAFVARMLEDGRIQPGQDAPRG